MSFETLFAVIFGYLVGGLVSLIAASAIDYHWHLTEDETGFARVILAVILWPVTLPIALTALVGYGLFTGGSWMARNLKLWRIPLEIHQHRRGDE